MRDMATRLESSEQHVQQLVRAAESLPSVEAELAERTQALSRARAMSGNAEERVTSMQTELDARGMELARVFYPFAQLCAFPRPLLQTGETTESNPPPHKNSHSSMENNWKIQAKIENFACIWATAFSPADPLYNSSR